MYCRNCGSKLDENAYVCVNCGVLVDSNINNSIPSRVYREKKKGDSNATGILSIIFSSLAVLDGTAEASCTGFCWSCKTV